MATSKPKIILKNKNLANREMTRADYLGMEMNELKNLVGSMKLDRRGRPSKKDYIDELMVRQTRRIRDTTDETKEEVYQQEEKTNGDIPRVIVETKQQEDGKRRYTINDFNRVKEEAFNIGSEQDFKNYIAGLKKRNDYPNQRGRISEEVYRKYIAMRKLNPLDRNEGDTKTNGELRSKTLLEDGELRSKTTVGSKTNGELRSKTVGAKLTIKDTYSVIYAEAKRLKFKSETGKKSSKEALLQFLENYRNAKLEAEKMGFVQPQGRRGRNTSVLPIKTYLDFIQAESFISIDKNTTKETVNNVEFEFIEKTVERSKTYKMKEVVMAISKKVKINRKTPLETIENLLEMFIDRIVRNNNLRKNDRISFYLESDDVRRFNFSLRKVGEFKGEMVATRIAKLLNSNEAMEIDGVSFVFQFVKQPEGGTHYILTNLTEEEKKNKRCIIRIQNGDNSCFVIALRVAIAVLNKKKGNISDADYKYLVKKFCTPKYVKMAQELYTQVGIPVDTRVSFGEIKQFEDHLNITINIFTGNTHRYPIDLENQHEDQVYLHFNNEHYEVITSPEAWLNMKDTKKFCNGCKKEVSKQTHKCETVGVFVKQLCLKCGEVHIEGQEEIICPDCNRNFSNQECFNNHKQAGKNGGKSLCDKIFQCNMCDAMCNNQITEDEFQSIKYRLKIKHQVYDGIELAEMNKAIHHHYRRTHFCGKIWCNACNDQVPMDNHQCFIGGLNDKQKQKYLPTNKIIFYDYETYCDPLTHQHIPNLVVAFRTDKDDVNNYTEHIFSVYDDDNTEDNTVNSRFCRWLFKNENRGYTCIAHNSKGYDIHFIKQYLYNNDIPINFSTIDTGCKSMSLKVKSLKMQFIDSLNFFASSLKALPKTYGLDAHIKKGDFPHFFNRPECFNHKGPYPPKKYYGYDTMTIENQKSFDEWYSTARKNEFDFKTELIEYCRNDVLVLMKAWLKFRQIFIDITSSFSDEYIEVQEEVDNRTTCEYFGCSKFSTQGRHMCKTHINIASRRMLKSNCSHIFSQGKNKGLRCSKYAIDDTYFCGAHKDSDCEPIEDKPIDQTEEMKYLEEVKDDNIMTKETIRVKQCLDPTKFITLASLCNAIYRCYFMPEKSIAILKENNVCYSVSELEWLLHMERTNNITIDKQFKIEPYYVDGFHQQSNTVYEFLGCYYHGCKHCFGRDIINKQKQKTMNTLCSEWMKKKEYLENNGYNVVSIWSHQWDTQKKSDGALRKMLQDNNHLTRAPFCNIRESFFGGRTEPFDLYAKSNDEQKIAYADFTSLYPSVQALESFPVGHPIRLNEFNNLDISNYYGFIYCKVKSNESLRIPILPEKSDDGKLIFSHGIKIGVWNSEELKLAVQNGYEILELYEVIHFENKSSELFADYIRVFFKIKAECSFEGKTEEDKDAFISDLNSGRFPVLLDREKLNYNAGMRQVAKLCLNTLWGKFGQRDNMLQTVIVKNDIDMFNRIIFDDKLEVSTINFLNDKTAEIKFRFITECVEQSKNTNIAIASFTTAHARRWLYRAMGDVGYDNVIYCDTDSIIYYHPTNNNPIKTDSKLGGMTDELGGDYIQEIIALAPKTYSYIKSSGKQVLKAKGFSLNASTIGQGVNFGTFKNIVTAVSNQDEPEVKNIEFASKIRLNASDKKIYSRNEVKKFQYTFNKRIVDYDNSSENRLTTKPLVM